MSLSLKRITVLGTGRWGTAFAIYLSRLGYEVTLLCHSRKTKTYLLEHDESPRLPGISCNGKIHFSDRIDTISENTDLIVLAVPVVYLRSALKTLPPLSPQVIFVGINKGIEQVSLQTPPQITADFFPENPYAQLGGPCFPQGLLSDKNPAAETLACNDKDLGRMLQKALSSSSFRIYLSKDVNGVAFLGALKNVYAIAAGMIDSQKLGEESLAVLLTRGLSEMRRFAQSMDIPDETLYGLAGLGDLALTCYSPNSSHNKKFGKKMGDGIKIDDIMYQMQGGVAEGYFTVAALHNLAKKRNISMPLTETLYHILYENLPLQIGLSDLMSRPLKNED